jgi:peptidyl-dipeptidase Dcp
MNRKFLSVIALSIMTLASCTNNSKPVATENPFLSDYGTPYEVPAFDKIQSEHYLPAFEEGMKQQKAEIDVIVKNRATPDFQNTILAYDKSGELLDKVGGVFFNLMECMSNDEMQNIAAEIMPKMSAHGDEISMNPLLFEKVKYVYDNRHNMNLDDQQIRVVEKYYSDFIRSGAG